MTCIKRRDDEGNVLGFDCYVGTTDPTILEIVALAAGEPVQRPGRTPRRPAKGAQTRIREVHLDRAAADAAEARVEAARAAADAEHAALRWDLLPESPAYRAAIRRVLDEVVAALEARRDACAAVAEQIHPVHQRAAHRSWVTTSVEAHRDRLRYATLRAEVTLAGR